ncbi:protein of unknown function [Vibrio tapetis subsp. tapetis]|uniref:Uncharacterized protein n=1 Tax=Vibrio tapetis subsp. tapetis TaxID=1671868 RepID=A0A2N8ZIQ6_9VIBR|nr:protein of unknown function [Vibrio tapetis subsp. tapetis]
MSSEGAYFVAGAAALTAGGSKRQARLVKRRIAPTSKHRKQKTKPMPSAMRVMPSNIIGS